MSLCMAFIIIFTCIRERKTYNVVSNCEFKHLKKSHSKLTTVLDVPSLFYDLHARRSSSGKTIVVSDVFNLKEQLSPLNEPFTSS